MCVIKKISLKNKIRNIIYLISGIILIYSVIAIPLSYSLSKNYDIELNEKRIEFGLFPITENWQLDSTILKGPNRVFECLIVDENLTTYRFLENKQYCQYWTNKKLDTTKPYLKRKEINFAKSFWIWENELNYETNIYINPRTLIADYIELETASTFEDKEVFYTSLSHFKNGEEILIFENFVFNEKMFGKEDQKVDSILKNWNIK